MSNLLVTGGAGFIGANFVRYWRNRHPDDLIVVLDLLIHAGRAVNLQGVRDCSLVRGDIADQALVTGLMDDHGIDTIVHFAAETHVDRSFSDSSSFVRANVVGTHRLLEAARAVWLDRGSGRAHRFHHISTDEVYGSLEAGERGFGEDSPYAPNSPYAASKAASDHLVRAYHRTFGLEATFSHCSNNYGPLQHLEKLIPLFLTNALIGRPLPIYGDGLNVREWIHVDDHCRGVELVLLRGRVGERYNLGSEEEMSNLAATDAICAAIDAAFAADPGLAARFPGSPPARGAPTMSLRTFVPDRPGHDRRYALDSGKARRELDYACSRRFADGLRDTLAWYIDHESWWRDDMEVAL